MKDQDVLDIITALNREMRFNPSFCALLHKCDDEESRHITQSYLEWLYKILENEPTPCVPVTQDSRANNNVVTTLSPENKAIEAAVLACGN
jgi:hypothetical protein